MQALEIIAKERTTTISVVAEEALAQYARVHAPQKFSFIGIGHSGKSDLSSRVDKLLAESAPRSEGWSLHQCLH